VSSVSTVAHALGVQRRRGLLGVAHGERRGLCRGQSLSEVLLHPLHALDVVRRVETQPAG
jgi:hypothetical protein